MTDFLRSILQTAHNASPQTAQAAAATVKTEVRPVDQIQVPPSACTLGVSADATASLLAMEKQRMIKVEIPDTSSTVAGTNILVTADASKAQRAARRDVVNARRETKRKTMSSSSDSDDCATAAASSSSPRADVDMTLASTGAASATAAMLPLEKSKKMKTGKTTSATVTATDAADVKTTKKSVNSPSSSPMSCSSSSSSMLFGSEIDALGEERLRAMEAQLESLDPDSKEAKKKRRLIRNRMSAQLHRERKKAYVGQLEDQLLEKERELQALQDKLNAMANESLLMKQQLAQTQAAAAVAPVVAAAPVTPAPPAAIVQIEDDVVIKAEPIVDVASAFDVPPTPVAATAGAKDSWDYCFPNLDDAEMADVAADDLLRDFDHPFAAYAAAMAHDQKDHHAPAHHEIHAAKKNIVMVMGMMFSATFFGNSPFFFDVQSGSTFSSYFQANPPKELSQFNMASKIMSSLEKSSWKDFRDIASWTSAPAAATAADAADVTTDADNDDADVPRAAASPSAASDITDSSGMCDSPAQQIDDCLGLTGLETDLIDEFVYPVDDPFAPALADTNWFGDDADDFGQSDVDDTDDDIAVTTTTTPSSHALSASNVAAASAAAAAPKTEPTPSITSRLFDKLTALWHEKNQVLLTVLDGKNEVTRRSVADMSAIRQSMANGSIFAAAAAAPHASAAPKTSPLGMDESVSFLYPLSAFSPAVEPTDPDVMFLEVSCQMSALSM